VPRTTKEPTVDALRARDRDAWTAFYDAHVRDVYAVIWHLVRGEGALAEELNQAVWLSAIESAQRFDPQRGTPQGWVIGIARNQVALHFRRRAMQRAVDANLAESQQAGAFESRSAPDQAPLRSEQSCEMRAALAQLAPDRRKLVEGKDVEGLSVRQLADRSGKSTKAVESMLQRARTELRHLLNRAAE
jgi:RNA polymerase sigma factor (sigma-70 family)